MNKFLPNLLLVFSMALCGLSAFQWVREGKLRKEIANLTDTIHTNRVTIQGLEITIKRGQSEIDRLEKIRNDLNATITTNTTRIKELDKLADKLTKENLAQHDTIEQYKTALETANERIQKQNEDVKRQNEAIKSLAQQRDEKVAELNKTIEEHNKVVKEYNKLVEDYEKLVKQAQEMSQQLQQPKK